MRFIVVLIVLMAGVMPAVNAQIGQSDEELRLKREFINRSETTTSELVSRGLVGNPDMAIADLKFYIKKFEVGQVETSGRYYAIVYNKNGTTSRTYLEYLTASEYMGNTVFCNSYDNPTSFHYWELNPKTLELEKIDIPNGIFN